MDELSNVKRRAREQGRSRPEWESHPEPELATSRLPSRRKHEDDHQPPLRAGAYMLCGSRLIGYAISERTELFHPLPVPPSSFYHTKQNKESRLLRILEFPRNFFMVKLLGRVSLWFTEVDH